MAVNKLELIFLVEEAPEGGYVAEALGESIITEADDLEELRRNVREAVQCHFEGRQGAPSVIRLHFTKQEVMTL